MKLICPPGYHQNGFVATHAFGPMIVLKKCMSRHKAIVVITARAHCFHAIYIYIYIYITYIYIYIYTYIYTWYIYGIHH